MADFRLETILKVRKIKGVTWDELAETLPVSGEALRIAFKRGSVQDAYLDVIENKLGIGQQTKQETEQNKTLESLLGESVYKKIKPVLDELRKENEKEFNMLNEKIEALKVQNRDMSELIIGLTSIYDEILSRVSDIQTSIKN